MKILFLTIVLILMLKADDIQRIESITKDIKSLRVKYSECINQLNAKRECRCDEYEKKAFEFEQKYYEQKQKNSALIKKLSTYKISKKCINSKMIDKYKDILKTMEFEIKQLKNQINQTKITIKKTSKNICKPVYITKDTNTFPKLKLKKIYQKQQIIKFKASAFKLKKNSVVYDAIDGKKLFVWNSGRTFTSNERSDLWIKITGYFVDKKWTPSKQSMWLEISNVVKK